MLTLFTLITLLTSVYSTVTDFKYSSCGISTDIAQNLILDVTPELPQDNYILYMNADFSKEITSGTSKYSITYNFLPLQPSINNLCEEMLNSNITCPLNDHISSESKGSIPTGVSGTVVIKNEWFTDTTPQERILCMNFNIKIK